MKMKKISLILAAAVCLAVFGVRAGNLSTSDFAHSIKLQVNGYAGTTTLTNFPVLVRISESGLGGFMYSDMKYPNNTSKTDSSYYRDLCFTDEEGNKLPYEIDSWSKGGESLVWVLLPTMSQGTKFFMYYGADAYEEATDRPWNDYVGV